jgi:mono/diheme cytochrome c family protein
MQRMIRAGITALVAVCALAAALVTGCRSTAPPAAQAAPAENAALEAAAGAELWADNCGRCHNMRDPSSYSPEQWKVAVHHMRTRVPLTGEEERAITEFLTSR